MNPNPAPSEIRNMVTDLATLNPTQLHTYFALEMDRLDREASLDNRTFEAHMLCLRMDEVARTYVELCRAQGPADCMNDPARYDRELANDIERAKTLTRGLWTLLDKISDRIDPEAPR